jgi:hypothetical protein
LEFARDWHLMMIFLSLWRRPRPPREARLVRRTYQEIIAQRGKPQKFPQVRRRTLLLL